MAHRYDLQKADVTEEEWKRSRMPPGTWFNYPLGPHYMRGERVHGGKRVMTLVQCPQCDRALTLSSNVHTVSADGLVAPSLVCTQKGCSWHVFVRLLGWADPKPETR
jgi:hypothetical protein